METNVNALKLQRRKVGIVTAMILSLNTVKERARGGARTMVLKWDIFGFNMKYYLLVTY